MCVIPQMYIVEEHNRHYLSQSVNFNSTFSESGSEIGYLHNVTN